MLRLTAMMMPKWIGLTPTACDHRQQQRRQDQNGRRRLEKTPITSSTTLIDSSSAHAGSCSALIVGDDLLRDAAGREQPGVEAGCRHDHQDLRDQEHRAQDDAPELAQADLAVHHHGHEQRIDHRDAGGFGRREYAAVDAAENDDDRADRPAGLLGRRPRSRAQRACAVSGTALMRA